MALDKPRCQTLIGRRKSGSPRKCGRLIEYVAGGVWRGWEHVEMYGHDEDIVPDPDWEIDHEQKVLKKKIT